jgi:hypothetical protein
VIENDVEYRVAKEQAARLEAGLAQMVATQPSVTVIDPAMQEMVKEGVRHTLAQLYAELADYEVRRGK